MAKWQKVSGKEVYRNAFYTVDEDVVIRPDGKEGLYSVVHKGHFCTIIALNEKQQIYFIRQFRYPTQNYGWELIKGGNDGQTPLEAAQRELQEEGGMQAAEWQEIGSHNSAASYCDEEGHILLAKALREGGHDAQEEEGITDCRAFSKAEYEEMILNGEIKDSITIAALYHARLAGFIE